MLAASVLLTVVGVVASTLLQRLASANEWLLHTREVQLAIMQIRAQLASAETAQRGYLLTGDALLLVPLGEMQQRIAQHVERFASLTRDNPRQQARVPELRRLTESRLQRLVEVAELAAAGRREEAFARVRSRTGSQLMEGALGVLDALGEEEERLLRERLDVAASEERLTQTMLVALTASAVLTLWALQFGATRSARRLARAHAQLKALADSLEEQVQDRTAQLTEANEQLEAYGYMVSHDLRAPLRAMVGYTDLLDDEHGESLGSEGRATLERMRAAAARMERLIGDLLDYSRLSRAALVIEPVPLERPLRQALAELAQQLTERAAEVDAATPLPTVLGNEVVLVQVLINLIGNAALYVRAGEPPRIRVRGTSGAKGSTRLTVADDGIGIAPEDQARIFQPFERLHGVERYPGSGIGLAIVRKGIERMGGRVGVESAPGRGSCFWFELPPAAPAA